MQGSMWDDDASSSRLDPHECRAVLLEALALERLREDVRNHVVCVDKDKKKIDLLQKGKVPIYEPGLSELVIKNFKNKKISFSTNLKKSVNDSDIIFICVGTPTKQGGSSADLSQIYSVAKEISS